MNLFSDIPESLPEELVTTIVESGSLSFSSSSSSSSIRIERIVSKGHSTIDSDGKEAWYDQEENEWVLVLKGEAILEFEDGKELRMNTGDTVNILAHRKHRVKWTKPDEQTIWLAIFY